MATLAACAPAPGPRNAGGSDAPGSAAPKRITASIFSSDPTMLRSSVGGGFGGFGAGTTVVEDLLHAGAVRRDDSDTFRPVLAEATPTVENGQWKVFPDGRMETTWTVKNGALWQDGTPLTAQDLLFTLTVSMDEDMVAFRGSHIGFSFLDTASAPDDRTITVTWKQTFIEADALFTAQFAMPMPKRLLERAYQENKRGLTDLPYWNHEFIGAGPFQIRDWVDGSHMTLAAFDRYILGRPKIDEIVVKFIPDPNAIVATMLAGEIEVNLGRGLSLEQALQIRDQLRESRLEVGVGNWIVAFPQFIDPQPIALLDVRFRRALVHAIDRQEMADTLQNGLTHVAYAYFDTSLPLYRELDPLVVKYDFDLRKAAQLVESAGYVRGADGSFRDSAGQRLSVEIRSSGSEELQQRSLLSVADYWQRAGIGAETVVVGAQRLRDFQYRATRPGFEMSTIPDRVRGLRRAYSSQTPLPENNYAVVGNVSRYVHPEFDAMLDRYFSTIPVRERMQALGQILQHTTDQVTLIPTFYNTTPMMVSNRLQGIAPNNSQEGTEGWNAYAWDVRN